MITFHFPKGTKSKAEDSLVTWCQDPIALEPTVFCGHYPIKKFKIEL